MEGEREVKRSSEDKRYPGYDGIKHQRDKMRFLMTESKRLHDELSSLKYVQDENMRECKEKQWDIYLRLKFEVERLDHNLAEMATMITKPKSNE